MSKGLFAVLHLFFPPIFWGQRATQASLSSSFRHSTSRNVLGYLVGYHYFVTSTGLRPGRVITVCRVVFQVSKTNPRVGRRGCEVRGSLTKTGKVLFWSWAAWRTGRGEPNNDYSCVARLKTEYVRVNRKRSGKSYFRVTHRGPFYFHAKHTGLSAPLEVTQLSGTVETVTSPPARTT